VTRPKPFAVEGQWIGDDEEGRDDRIEVIETFDSFAAAFAHAKVAFRGDDPPAYIEIHERVGVSLVDPLGVWDFEEVTRACGTAEDFEGGTS
jgi:hypothetical protein